MPRIQSPSAQAIKADPRSFALFKALAASDGTVPDEAFQTLLTQYNQTKAAGNSELSFEEFAALFQKPSSTAESGNGNCIGWAAHDATSPLKPWRFTRRETGPNDVRIQICYAGICHSDIHQARNEWKGSKYPLLPGHEIAGIVTEIGAEVTKFKVGDKVGVGCVVGSCRGCDACDQDEEQHCSASIGTYNSTDWDGTRTYGGYSTFALVNQHYVLRIPDNLNFADAAPLLCAGITTYSPIRYFGLDKPGMRVGVVGLGGLGHMAVKFLKALGVHTTVISTSPNKKEEAISQLGADAFIVSKNEDELKAAANTLDGVIDTVSGHHELQPLMGLMKLKGKYILLGVMPDPPLLPTMPLIFRKQILSGSMVGGIKETQEMLDFCAEKGVSCMVEHIPIEYVNTAYDRVMKSDVRYRFVIDILDSLIN